MTLIQNHEVPATVKTGSGYRTLAAVVVGLAVLGGAALLNGRAIEQYLFGYGDIYNFLLYHTKWPEEAVKGAALLVWALYTVAFTVLSYSAIGRVFVGRPTWRSATIGLLAIAAQAPLLFFQAWLHESPTPITDLSELQCFDTRTKGRVVVWYYRGNDGSVILFENGYGGTWRGQELQPATQEICDLAQMRWKASEIESQSKEAAKKAAEAEQERKLAALEKTHNFSDANIAMQWGSYDFPLLYKDNNVGLKLTTFRTISQPKGQKAKAELAFNVCNTGQQGITEGRLYIWFVPDDHTSTLRWSYTLNDLPTGGCGHYAAATEVDDISSLRSLAGTLYFSDTVARHLTSMHVADVPTENAIKAPDLASYAPPAAIPQRQIPTPVPPPDSDRCWPGNVFVDRLGRCIPAAPGSQNNCPDDHIYITRLSSCLPIRMLGSNYRIYIGNQFTVSGRQRKTIEMLEGAGVVTDASSQAYFISAGERIEIYGAATFRADTFSRINIFYE